MATLQTNPDSVPDDVVEWTRELNVSEIGRVGKLNIGFTLWDETSTAVPSVEEGAIVEISNSVYVETGDVALNTASQTVDSINWVIYVVSGSTATATLTGTAPTEANWDTEKGGFYDGSGDRYTGHYMYVSPAGTAYSNKGFLDYAGGAMLRYRIDDALDEFVVDANLDVKEDLNVDGTASITGAVSMSSTLAVTGNASANSINTDNKAIKMKYFTVEFAGTTFHSFATGLTESKILGGIAFSLDNDGVWITIENHSVSGTITLQSRDTGGAQAITGTVNLLLFYTT